jgi:phytoene dehydrogenase-like protein
VSARLDGIVIGAGANGLTAAATLGKAGRRILVLEARDAIGGLAGSIEFQPGFRGPGPLHDTGRLRPWVVRELGLEAHGLRLRARPEPLTAIDDSGGAVTLSGDLEQTAAALDRAAAGDGKAWRRYHADHAAILDLLRAFVDEPPVDLVHAESMGLWDLGRRALRVRRLGRRQMMEALRLPALSIRDALGEYFRGGLVQAALALPAVGGTWTAPRSPGSNLNLLLDRATSGPGVEGGGAALLAALERCARSCGVDLRTGAEVAAVLVDRGRVRGVRLAGGEAVEAPRVISSIHPASLLLDRLPLGALTWRTRRRVENFRSRGTTSQVLLALGGPPAFRGAGRPLPRVVLAPDLEAIERAFDPVKYRQVGRPVLEYHAVEGGAGGGGVVASVLVHFTPYHREPAWDEDARERLGDLVLEILEAHAPGIGARLQGRLVRTPRDLEAAYSLPGGHIHHGEHALDQLLVRPVPECCRYRTPVEGLWLCGGGSHPGGGLTCAPGGLAAKAILGE